MKIFSFSFKFNLFKKTYAYHWRLSFFLLCLILFSLFLILGNWQLHRYHEKSLLLTHYHERLKQTPVPLPHGGEIQNDMDFLPVYVEGQYLINKTVLIQNQFYQDQSGYEVIIPFKIVNDNRLLLVDKGWISQQELASFFKNTKTRKQKITGYIRFLDKHHFILGSNILDATASPLVVQKIDFSELSTLLKTPLRPYLLRLTSPEEKNLIRNWPVTSLLPQRHLGYAIQWFMMAIALAIAYLCFSLELKK